MEKNSFEVFRSRAIESLAVMSLAQFFGFILLLVLIPILNNAEKPISLFRDMDSFHAETVSYQIGHIFQVFLGIGMALTLLILYRRMFADLAIKQSIATDEIARQILRRVQRRLVIAASLALACTVIIFMFIPYSGFLILPSIILAGGVVISSHPLEPKQA